MSELNGKDLTKKRAFVTITPYAEQEKRVLNGSVPNATTAAPAPVPAPVPAPSLVPPPPPPPLPLPTKNTSNEDSVEMQSIESFKLKETPNSVIPKPPATYFPVTNSPPVSNGSPRHVISAKLNGSKEQSAATVIAATAATTTSNASTLETPKTAINASLASPQNPKPTVGKVAIRIGAYEGEAKQPAKLDFLSQQSRVEKNGTDEANGPVVSRLQNELAATLQRSNLRKKTDGEIQLPAKSINENTTTDKEVASSEPNKLTQGNVEKLASALSNRVTIRVSPEDGGR